MDIHQQLLQAIAENNLQWAARALREGAHPDGDPTLGTSPLFNSLDQEGEAMVQLLLDHGADPNRGCSIDFTPLTLAPTIPIARILLAAGASLHRQLHRFSWKGQLDMLAFLLDQPGTDIDACCEEFGWTPVGYAASEGDAEALDLLLRRGADPDLCDPDRSGYSPLSEAADRRHLRAVRVLLAYGADPNRGWGYCSNGRETIQKKGGNMLQALQWADSWPADRRPRALELRQRFRGLLPEPVPVPHLESVNGQTHWVFGPWRDPTEREPRLTWNGLWGVVRAGKARWFRCLADARADLEATSPDPRTDPHVD